MTMATLPTMRKFFEMVFISMVGFPFLSREAGEDFERDPRERGEDRKDRNRAEVVFEKIFHGWLVSFVSFRGFG
jgi:hypothetical protein